MRIESQNRMMLPWMPGGQIGTRGNLPTDNTAEVQFAPSKRSLKAAGLASGYGPRSWGGLETRGRFVDQVV